MIVAQLRPRRTTLALMLLCVVQFMVVLDASIVAVALPSIRDDLGFAPADLQLVMSVYALVFGCLLVLGGGIADFVGRRRCFRIGLGVFTTASLACGLAPTATVLVVARGVRGLGAALVAPAALALVTDLFGEGPLRNRALGVWGAVSAAGGAAGLLMGGLLTDTVGWPWAFLVNVPVGVVGVAAGRRVLPGVPGDRSRQLDVPGAISLVVCLAAVLGAILVGERVGFASPTTIALMFGATAAAITLVRRERRAVSPLLPPALVRRPTVIGANVGGLVVAAAIAGQSYFGSLYLQRLLGLSAFATGLSTLPVTLVALATSAVGARLVGRCGVRVVIGGSLGAVSASLVLLARIRADGSYVVDVLPGFTLFGAGLGAAYVATTIAATDDVLATEQGVRPA